ncbi:MAG TPA: hypothetical protein VL442_13775 [Mucilaginibacter sp.]|nr:hypothetical protein [Mucilaginibacter sp.]
MDNGQLYDEIQEIKTAFVITFLIAVYCFFMIIRFVSVHVQWKAICSSVGFIIVSTVDTALLLQLVRLKRAYKNIPEDSE